jgi:threonyl-tRNA synthetase
MIHRAVLGSLERFLSVMIEHYAGRFPLWLSPEQCRVVTISEKSDIWASDVHLKLLQAGIRCTLDTRPDTINKKIRDAELDKVNYVLVVGEKEAAAKAVNVRARDEVTGQGKAGPQKAQVVMSV